MANPSKAKGTKAESAVVAWAVMSGVPAIRPALGGAEDHGDVWLWPQGNGARVMVEVKDCPSKFAHFPSGVLLQDWWAQTEREVLNVPDADLGILVVKPKGVGHNRAGEWWAWALTGDLLPWEMGSTSLYHGGPQNVPGMWPFGSLLAWLSAVKQ
jgi:hypothetical protein